MSGDELFFFVFVPLELCFIAWAYWLDSRNQR